MFDKLDDLLIRFEEVLNELGEPGVTDNQERFQKLMKEQSDLQPIVDTYTEYKKNKETIQDSLSMLEEEKDEDMREMPSWAWKNWNRNSSSCFFQKTQMTARTLSWRSVQVPAVMRRRFLQQRSTVCM